ncbi:MAG: hypothetical protein ACI4OE_07060 [Alphaproteobacteria bacterium]
MSTLISGSTWSKVASNIVIDVQTSVPVKGNGTTLGLTDGTNYVGFGNVSSQGYTQLMTNMYGTNVGTNTTQGGIAQNKTYGVTTDSSKSGLTATVTRTNLSINIWKRTA